MPYRPVDGRGWRLSMGLRALDEASWFEIDQRCDDDLTLKDELLRNQFDTVVIHSPEANEAAQELALTVEEWMDHYAPGRRRSRRDSDLPIVTAARQVSDDLCVLVRDTQWRLRSACVCFPSRWNLASKLGQSLDEIHGPVPGYSSSLAGPTRTVCDRLRPDKPYWRLNWTLLDSPELHQPSSASATRESGLENWFFRVERQTLRRLPVSGAIVFAIHTYVASLAQLSDSPEFIEHVVGALETAPLPVQEYKGWVSVAQQLRASDYFSR